MVWIPPRSEADKWAWDIEAQRFKPIWEIERADKPYYTYEEYLRREGIEVEPEAREEVEETWQQRRAEGTWQQGDPYPPRRVDMQGNEISLAEWQRRWGEGGSKATRYPIEKPEPKIELEPEPERKTITIFQSARGEEYVVEDGVKYIYNSEGYRNIVAGGPARKPPDKDVEVIIESRAIAERLGIELREREFFAKEAREELLPLIQDPDVTFEITDEGVIARRPITRVEEPLDVRVTPVKGEVMDLQDLGERLQGDVDIKLIEPSAVTVAGIKEYFERIELLELPIKERELKVAEERIREAKESEFFVERLYGAGLGLLPEKIKGEIVAPKETLGGPTPVSEAEWERFIKVTERQERGLAAIELFESTIFLLGAGAGVAGRSVSRVYAVRDMRATSLEEFDSKRFQVDTSSDVYFLIDVFRREFRPEGPRVVPVREKAEPELDLIKNFGKVVDRRIISTKEFSEKTRTISPLTLTDIAKQIRRKEPKLTEIKKRAVPEEEIIFFIREGKRLKPMKRMREEIVKDVSDIEVKAGKSVQVIQVPKVTATEKVRRVTQQVVKPKEALRPIYIDDVYERTYQRRGEGIRAREIVDLKDVALGITGLREGVEEVTAFEDIGIGEQIIRQKPRQIQVDITGVDVSLGLDLDFKFEEIDIDTGITPEVKEKPELVPTGGVFDFDLRTDVTKRGLKSKRAYREYTHGKIGDLI